MRRCIIFKTVEYRLSNVNALDIVDDFLFLILIYLSFPYFKLENSSNLTNYLTKNSK